MVLHDHEGAIIFYACPALQHCQDATEAELLAIEEGICLSLHWSPLNFIVESDCAEAVNLIRASTPNTSAFAFRINIIRKLIRERDINLVKISREANTVSHELARLGRVQGRTEFWLGSTPPDPSEVVALDCHLVVA